MRLKRSAAEIMRLDMANNWHPYTQMKDCLELPPIAIERARGLKLHAAGGKSYYDTISSWWCNVHGHCHPHIVNAVKKQIGSLDHVLFAGFTHRPAAELSEMLLEIAPENLGKIFYSDNGSTAVEVALKMSFQYWKNSGVMGREKFLSLDLGYHGDTIGAMGVSGVSGYNALFKPLFADSYKTCAPYCYRCPLAKQRTSCSLECLGEAEKVLKDHSQNIAAIILEPLLLGAGGMIVYPAEYLKGIYGLSRKYNVHLILDEVATGFGRTGKMFACEHAGISPDIMCISKGITSGSLPLGATLVTNDIYNAFFDDYRENKTFFHGHTYTANPVACAAAIASLEIFERERSLDNVKMINGRLNSFLAKVKDLPATGDIRSIGVVGAIELVREKGTKETFPAEKRISYKIYKQALEEGLILRPLGNVIYFFLPLSAKSRELDLIFERSYRILNDVLSSNF